MSKTGKCVLVTAPSHGNVAYRGGFTLVEVMFASSITILLFMILFETLLTCRRMATAMKWRLAADAIAYDNAYEVFNRPLTWFDEVATNAIGDWVEIPTSRSTAWGQGQAFAFWSVTPNGIPATNWTIRTDVSWESLNLSVGGTRLPRDYELVRHRTGRNIVK